MEHQTHISEKPDISPVARIVAAVAILVVICGGGAYLIYDSGLWNPQVQHTNP
jgi:hypothetical protein